MQMMHWSILYDHAHEIDRQEDHDDRDEENGVDEDECEQEYSDTFSQNSTGKHQGEGRNIMSVRSSVCISLP